MASNANKNLAKDNLNTFVITSKVSKKGGIIPDATVATYVFQVAKNDEEGMIYISYGMAIKNRNELYIERVGKGIAYRRFKTDPFVFKLAASEVEKHGDNVILLTILMDNVKRMQANEFNILTNSKGNREFIDFLKLLGETLAHYKGELVD